VSKCPSVGESLSQTQAILSAEDGDKFVGCETKGRCFSSSRFIYFGLLLLVDIIFGSARSGPVQSGPVSVLVNKVSAVKQAKAKHEED
jgi:hypothetical protein